MKKLIIFLLAAGAWGAMPAWAQSTPSSDGTIDILDPAAKELISPDAKVETAYFAKYIQDYFFEGPVWDKRNNRMFVSALAGNTIEILKDGKLIPYIKDIYKGHDVAAIGGGDELNGIKYHSVGADGMTIDREGRLVYASIGERKIVRQEKDGKLTVLADTYEGHHLNSPNDIVVKSDGTIYFTEFQGSQKSTDFNPQEGAPGPAIYMIKDGKLILLDRDVVKKGNGLAFSPDEKYLYVDDSGTKKIVRFDVNADDTLSNGKVFVDPTGDKHPGGASAVKVDTKGNLWATAPGGIWIITPEGKHIATIRVIRLSNIAFGDPDGKSLYMTGPGYILRVRTEIAGVLP